MYKRSLQNGFTLVEMIISLAIFTVVAVVAVGALLKVMDANRKSISLKTTINNLNFALESMSREMRVGRDYDLDHDNGVIIDKNYFTNKSNKITSGNWTIAFRSSNISTDSEGKKCNLVFAYRYDESQEKLLKAQQPNCDSSIGSSNFQDLTSEDIKITSTIIEVSNEPNEQPYVFIWLQGESGVKVKDKVDFSVQTRVSQRIK